MATASLGKMTILAPVPRPTTNFAPIWLVDALGYGAAEGLDVEIRLAGAPSEAVAGVVAGDGDMTFVNIVFTLLARDRGVALRPFYGFVRAQNRAFSVPEGSPIRSLADLRGKTVGLHYDDPELFQFACAALIGAGVDPHQEVTFKPLPGSPLDAERMAAAIRAGEVDAVWQLDVLAGLMAAEGVALRLLPSSLIDGLTPSSCLNALDARLAARPAAYAAIGRAVAKATLFALTNPEAAIRLIWKTCPGAGPRPGEDADQVFRRERAALAVRLEGHRIDRAPIKQWGAISDGEIAAWQSFLLGTGAIGTRRPSAAYFSDALVTPFNAFDPAPIIAQAKEFRAA